eukprot:TRINITY_DN73906_c0_g1_i1.p1 TRINITY_DN73906_c0_g1~~TRINITY_DN73906_c0_g1_i1.p1  ORF type:complete len:835 (+),score=90.29 TRINITY_DN73906_c0_g1_i1:78-2507(+)
MDCVAFMTRVHRCSHGCSGSFEHAYASSRVRFLLLFGFLSVFISSAEILSGAELGAISAGANLVVTDWETKLGLGSCAVPVPKALSCSDMPGWGPFLSNLQANAREGFPMDEALYRQAQQLLHDTHDKPYPPQDFFKYLCGALDAVWPLPDKFCLYGFVGALFVRSRHLMLSSDFEVRKAADMDFQYATTVLGKEGSVDFLDSSPWPVSILDIYLNINQTEFITYEEYCRRNPVRLPAVHPESLHWKPSLAPEYFDSSHVPPRVLLAVVGTHATLSLEPVDMLRRFVHDVELRAVFFGLEPRWCNILGMCDQGTTALSQLFKDAEQDPYAHPWSEMVRRIEAIYDSDANLQGAQVLLCTEPLAGCLMLREVASSRQHDLPILGYLGVALLNNCPPQGIGTFWQHLVKLQHQGPHVSSLAVNNLILSEQTFYQTGYRLPYVRAHGLYTEMAYTPFLPQILMWRAPLFVYSTTRCAMIRFLQGMPDLQVSFRFLEESENLPYKEVAQHRAVALFPWDHALMTFYELYSAGIPLLLPQAEWMYRFLYQRGQLSVGERMYQSIRPGHVPPRAEFAQEEIFKERSGPPDPAVGMSSAKAARGVAEDMLTRGMDSDDLATAHQYLKAALDLIKDMKYFLAVAENRTDVDTYTSMGVVRRALQVSPLDAPADDDAVAESAPTPAGQSEAAEPWHPYTPFQMSPTDSNDWTRMRKGGWWLRRGVRFDAMRYWYQFSDFSRFPGLHYFSNLPELICLAQGLDVYAAAETMRRYNEKTLVHSASFWVQSLAVLMSSDKTSAAASGAAASASSVDMQQPR